MLYGTTFTRKYAERILPRFTEWVENIANGQLIGFFDVLGKYLREAIDDMKANPDAYADEQSVMKVCLAVTPHGTRAIYVPYLPTESSYAALHLIGDDILITFVITDPPRGGGSHLISSVITS